MNESTTADLSGDTFARLMRSEDSVWVEIWDLTNWKAISTTPTPLSILSLKLSPDGKLLAAVVGIDFRYDRIDSSLFFWRTDTGELIYNTKADYYSPGIAFSPDSNTLSIGQDGFVKLVDIRAINRIAQMPPDRQALTEIPQ